MGVIQNFIKTRLSIISNVCGLYLHVLYEAISIVVVTLFKKKICEFIVKMLTAKLTDI